MLRFAGAGALRYVSAALLSAGLRVGFSPSHAIGLMFLVSQSKCIINSLRVNGSDGKGPSGCTETSACFQIACIFNTHIW